ncbi:hypothetical protein V5E97_31655 [Singulisphaera sp. Ch08]|uniref:Alpha/beta hydrolase n=1 Tax=Singulisphaera sp. Ch08 TaxID=3120278 RepID=A0AAU7CDQ8_9BACT
MMEFVKSRRGKPLARSLFGSLVLAGLLVIPGGNRGRVLAQPPGLILTSPAASLEGVPARLDAAQALVRSKSAHREAKRLEDEGSPTCVDRYYEATVFAYAALTTQGGTLEAGWDQTQAPCHYNQNLADCLRTAGTFGRLDPRSHLQINGPAGPIVVQITHRGFVWSPQDFEELHDARSAPKNPAQHRSYQRAGLGAAEVSARSNPKLTPSDRFLAPRSYFPATAILHPELGPWIGLEGGAAQSVDLLELYDPLRATCVELGGSRYPLACNLDAPVAMAEASIGSRRIAFIGFLYPSTVLDNAFLGFMEPYQPGKIPVVFVHGLRDNPYTFTDIINGLRSRPGFLDQYQIVGYQYPTGINFIRSAALFRRSLRDMAATFDPQSRDPGLQNSVFIGHSMGGLLIKLQITWSGDAIWRLASTQPLESLIASESTKTFLRDLFFFEPLPFVRRVVFMGTPHDGAALANRAVGRVTSRLVQRSPDSCELVAQLQRDNPGAVLPYIAKLPTSIDLLTKSNPILEAMRQLPINPATTYHTIAGTSMLPPQFARGDGVVPLSSAHSDGAASEHWIPTTHTRMNASPYTLMEVDRILRMHLAETAGVPQAGRYGTAAEGSGNPTP